jgi:hypothetical protein
MILKKRLGKYFFWIQFDWKVFGLGVGYTPYVALGCYDVKFSIDIWLPFLRVIIDKHKN